MTSSPVIAIKYSRLLGHARLLWHGCICGWLVFLICLPFCFTNVQAGIRTNTCDEVERCQQFRAKSTLTNHDFPKPHYSSYRTITTSIIVTTVIHNHYTHRSHHQPLHTPPPLAMYCTTTLSTHHHHLPPHSSPLSTNITVPPLPPIRTSSFYDHQPLLLYRPLNPIPSVLIIATTVTATTTHFFPSLLRHSLPVKVKTEATKSPIP